MQSVSDLQRDEQALLQEKFWQHLRWERVKRREQILVSAFFYSLLASLMTFPVGELLPPWAGPLSLTLLLFLVIALAFFLRRPWGSRESLRTISLLDKTLHLQERAVTAWEILGRREKRPAELLVLEEAAAKLKPVNPRGLFKRKLSWHAYLAPPLLLFWVLLAWLGVGLHWDWVKEPKVVSIAQKLKEFSRGLHDRAKEDELTESLKTARALEEVAERGLKGEIGEEKLREELTEVARRIRDLGQGASMGSGGSQPPLSRETLSDLKAEVGKLEDALKQTLAGKGIQESDILESLAGLSPFMGELEDRLLSMENLDREEIGDLLNRLEGRVRAGLDRHTLKETREFLLLLLGEMEGGEAVAPLQRGSEAQPGWSSSGQEGVARGSLPGDQPGRKGEEVPLPAFKARATTHLKGLLGKGLSTGLTFRGEFQGGESEVPQEEVVTSYQRQIEGELASEQIPQELKEPIKKYFLSLGMTEGKRGVPTGKREE